MYLDLSAVLWCIDDAINYESSNEENQYYTRVELFGPIQYSIASIHPYVGWQWYSATHTDDEK